MAAAKLRQGRVTVQGLASLPWLAETNERCAEPDAMLTGPAGCEGVGAGRCGGAFPRGPLPPLVPAYAPTEASRPATATTSKPFLNRESDISTSSSAAREPPSPDGRSTARGRAILRFPGPGGGAGAAPP